jgi:hypothetical protein
MARQICDPGHGGCLWHPTLGKCVNPLDISLAELPAALRHDPEVLDALQNRQHKLCSILKRKRANEIKKQNSDYIDPAYFKNVTHGINIDIIPKLHQVIEVFKNFSNTSSIDDVVKQLGKPTTWHHLLAALDLVYFDGTLFCSLFRNHVYVNVRLDGHHQKVLRPWYVNSRRSDRSVYGSCYCLSGT